MTSQRMMTGILALAALTAPAGVCAGAAPIEGRWVFHIPCGGATGMYAERCAKGERDLFELDLAVKDGKVCGGYQLTAQIGNREDDSDLSDWRFTPAGPGAYDVRFHVAGSTGRATLRLNGAKLVWHTVSVQPDPPSPDVAWVFEPPPDAVLVRLESDASPVSCDS